MNASARVDRRYDVVDTLRHAIDLSRWLYREGLDVTGVSWTPNGLRVSVLWCEVCEDWAQVDRGLYVRAQHPVYASVFATRGKQ